MRRAVGRMTVIVSVGIILVTSRDRERSLTQLTRTTCRANPYRHVYNPFDADTDRPGQHSTSNTHACSIQCRCPRTDAEAVETLQRRPQLTWANPPNLYRYNYEGAEDDIPHDSRRHRRWGRLRGGAKRVPRSKRDVEDRTKGRREKNGDGDGDADGDDDDADADAGDASDGDICRFDDDDKGPHKRLHDPSSVAKSTKNKRKRDTTNTSLKRLRQQLKDDEDDDDEEDERGDAGIHGYGNDRDDNDDNDSDDDGDDNDDDDDDDDGGAGGSTDDRDERTLTRRRQQQQTTTPGKTNRERRMEAEKEALMIERDDNDDEDYEDSENHPKQNRKRDSGKLAEYEEEEFENDWCDHTLSQGTRVAISHRLQHPVFVDTPRNTQDWLSMHELQRNVSEKGQLETGAIVRIKALTVQQSYNNLNGRILGYDPKLGRYHVEILLPPGARRMRVDDLLLQPKNIHILATPSLVHVRAIRVLQIEQLPFGLTLDPKNQSSLEIFQTFGAAKEMQVRSGDQLVAIDHHRANPKRWFDQMYDASLPFQLVIRTCRIMNVTEALDLTRLTNGTVGILRDGIHRPLLAEKDSDEDKNHGISDILNLYSNRKRGSGPSPGDRVVGEVGRDLGDDVEMIDEQDGGLRQREGYEEGGNAGPNENHQDGLVQDIFSDMEGMECDGKSGNKPKEDDDDDDDDDDNDDIYSQHMEVEPEDQEDSDDDDDDDDDNDDIYSQHMEVEPEDQEDSQKSPKNLTKKAAKEVFFGPKLPHVTKQEVRDAIGILELNLEKNRRLKFGSRESRQNFVRMMQIGKLGYNKKFHQLLSEGKDVSNLLVFQPLGYLPDQQNVQEPYTLEEAREYNAKQQEQEERDKERLRKGEGRDRGRETKTGASDKMEIEATPRSLPRLPAPPRSIDLTLSQRAKKVDERKITPQLARRRAEAAAEVLSL
eukprot:CAMPEP_0184503498 /NCGR_PEP_ID=MMETSP0113_2-20130426/51924_1 /TAXON_ID=91329 /ORGANISM="Norrisiella sphaerica, Strain BC52" /LENGTH=934 /DNA_ID=CAMNT_0026893001 /DNA_START=24 /DNA_END=2829 /DNA_ORIENTATION=+